MLLILSSYLMSGLIIGFGVFQGRKLFGAYEQTTTHVQKMVGKLESCKEGTSFKEVLQGWVRSEDLVTRNIAKSLFRIFEKKPVQLHDRIGWIVDFEDICDGKRYYKSHISFGKVEAMPGILTGIGILFTFLGLTIGVFGLDPTNADQMTQGVKRLLGGMSMAFLTSIAGIGASLWWTWRNKDVAWHFETAFSDFSNMLQAKSFLLVPEEMNLQFIDQQVEQTKALTQLEESVYTGFTRALEQSVFKEIKDLLAAQAGAGQNQDLPRTLELIQRELTSISGALQQNAQINENLIKAFGQMSAQQKSLDNVGVDAKSQARLVADTRDVLAGLGNVQAIQGDTVATIKAAGEELKRLIKHARLATENVAKSQQGLAVQYNRLEEHWSVYRDQMQGMQETLKGTMDEFGSGMNDSLTGVHGEIDGLLAKSMEHFNAGMKDFEATLAALSAVLKSSGGAAAPAKKSSWLGKNG